MYLKPLAWEAEDDIFCLPMCLSFSHLYVVEGLWTENLPPADLSLRYWQIYYDKKWPKVDGFEWSLVLVCVCMCVFLSFIYLFYNARGWGKNPCPLICRQALTTEPHLLPCPWGGPFHGSPSRSAGFISQMFGSGIWIEKPLDSIKLQLLAFSSPRLKIHLIIELDVSQRLFKPPLKDLIGGLRFTKHPWVGSPLCPRCWVLRTECCLGPWALWQSLQVVWAFSVALLLRLWPPSIFWVFPQWEPFPSWLSQHL